MGATKSGKLLPPQLLYEGKTDCCHAKGVDYPADWHIYHSSTHWSNAQTMMKYVKEVLVPYVKEVKNTSSIYDSVKPLLIFDVYKAHRDQELLQLIKDSGFVYTFVPASCTGELQPLDLTVNAQFKRMMKGKFIDWYSAKIAENCIDKVDLKLSVLKPIHARWMIDVYAALGKQPDLVKAGFRKAGIV